MPRPGSASSLWWLNYLIVIIVVISLGLVISWEYNQVLNVISSDSVVLHPAKKVATERPPTTQTIPAARQLTVPFTVQAPLGVWDATHEEACEEASLLMAVHYKTGQAFSSPAAAESEIQALISWETDRGYAVDLTVAELRKIALDRFSLKSDILNNPTAMDIKKALSQNQLVIVPAAGRSLPNPYFTPPGPVYHMLVVTGYTADQFTTNDPGTKHGEGFTYTYDGLLKAIHDWNSVNILDGVPRVLVIN